jgi:autotransporter-associated beta strand protein
MHMKTFAAFRAVALALTFGALNLCAATYTWTGAGFMGTQDYLWSNPYNWLGLAAPSTGESNLTVILPNTAAPRATTNDIAGLTVKSIRFQGDNYVVAGKAPGAVMALTFDRFSGDTIEATANNGQFANNLVLVLTNDITVDVDPLKTFAIRAALTGHGGVTKTDAGTLHFNSLGNSYGGETFVTDGILDLQCAFFGPSVAVPGPLLIGGTNLSLSPVVRLLNDDQITDGAPVTVNANGKLWLNTHDDTVGPLTLVGGLVNTGLGGGSSSPGLLSLNGHVTNRASGVNPFSTISGRLSLDLLTRVIDVGTNSELGIDASISGAVGFNAGITKTGPGLLSLYNATNTYNGTTTISNGTLSVSQNRPLLGSTNGGTVVTAPGRLHIAGFAVGQESLIIIGSAAADALVFEGSNYWAGPILANTARVHGDPDATLVLNGAVSGGQLRTTGYGEVHLTGSQPNTVFDLVVERGDVFLNKPSGVDAFGGRVWVGNTNDNFLSAVLSILTANQFPTFGSATIYRSGALSADGVDDRFSALTIHGGLVVSFNSKFTLNGNVTNLYHPSQNGMIFGQLALGAFQRTFHCETASTLYLSAVVTDAVSGGITKTGPGRLTLATTNTYVGPTIVQDGFLALEEMGRPGSTASGTEVLPGGVLQLTAANVTNELLTLHGHPSNYSIYVRDQSAWAGNVSLLSDAGVQFELANGLTNRLVIDGAIAGPGGLRSDGEGELVLRGSGDNTFAGPLWIRSSDARLQKSGGATAVGSLLRAGKPTLDGTFATVVLGAPNQIGNSAPVQLDVSGELNIGAFNDTVGALQLNGGDIDGTTGVLTLNGDVSSVDNISTSYVDAEISLGGVTRTFDFAVGGNATFREPVQDGGAGAGIVKTGDGILKFNALNTYSGATLVNAGELELEGNGRPGSSAAGTTVATGASVQFINSRITNELLVLHDTSVYFEQTNEWRGPVQLNGAGMFWNYGADARLLVAGTISGGGSLAMPDAGRLQLAGSQPNTYAGDTVVKAGTLVLGKTTGPAIPGHLTVGSTNTAESAVVITEAPQQFNAATNFLHTYLPSAQLNCQGHDQRVPPLTLIDGYVNTLGGVLALNGDLAAGHSTGTGNYIDGQLALGTALNPAGQRTLIVSNSSTLTLYAGVRDGGATTNLLKIGGGHLSLHESNSFSGSFHAVAGGVHIQHPRALGLPGMGSVFATNTYVTLNNLGTNWMPEPLTLHGADDLNAYAVSIYGTNRLSGPVAIAGYVRLTQGGLLECSGPVTGGSNSMLVLETDTLRFTGSSTNTFAGTTRLYSGVIELAKTNATAIAGPVELGTEYNPPGAAVLRWLQPHQCSDQAPLWLKQSGQVELQNHSDAIGSLRGNGNALLGTGTLTTGGDGTSTVFDGVISGASGALTKTGPGIFTLTATNTHTGATTVNGGVLRVHGHQPQSPVSLLTGGTIGGNGRVGNISALNGHVAPGASPGNLTSGNLSFFSPASLLRIEIHGTNAGVNYDQADVIGSVLLMGGTLDIAMNFPGAVSNQYVIVNNDGADPVNGTFTALPEGGTVTNAGVVFAISYHGGDGNDIVLTQQNVSSGAQIGGIQKLPGGQIQITATGLPNTLYTVEATTSLNAPVAWDELGQVTANGAGLLQFIDPADFNHVPIRFYRFRLP